jgi:Right handed beta helix region
VVTIPAGVDRGNYDVANTTYYFSPGVHTLGTNVNDQIDMGLNDWYVGERSGQKGAILDGQSINNYALESQTGDADWVEYLTVRHFTGAYAIGESNINGAGANQTVDYDTVEFNYPGSGVELGTNGVARHDCLTSNGDYGIQAYSTYDVSSLTTGPSNVTVQDNEISYNDQCNWEAVPAAYWPITSPRQCGQVGNIGCGCAGGAHFWNVDASNFSGNYVHNNYDVASWWDTDNNGETIEDNYYADNFDSSIVIEISYNALIEDNNFVDNEWGAGACGAAPGNPCYTTGNLDAAIYISESGGNNTVVGRANGIDTISIIGDNFLNDWDGVELYQSSDRFCGSPDNTSAGYCTLVPSSTAQGGGRSSASHLYYANGSDTPGGCGQVDLAAARPSGSPDYYDNCQWKTQNVLVTGDTFSLDASAIPGCSPNSASPCGENGIVSVAPSGISWSPYQTTASGNAVPDAITDCQGVNTFTGCEPQHNYFTHNIYAHTGSQAWQFFYWHLGNTVSATEWRSFGQDAGSSFS